MELLPALAPIQHYQFWFALPLIVSISFVYGATRHELLWPILNHTVRAAIWISSFMLIIFGVLFALSWLFL